MKHILISILLFYSLHSSSQEKTIIQLKVPNKDDVVYIAGNQSSLGNWDYDRVKMYKVSDYYRMIAVELNYPAEFKFTRGSLDTEGIYKSIGDNPNFILKDTLSKIAYRIKGWRDEMLKSQLKIGFQYLPFQSKVMDEERTVKVYLPKYYTKEKKYPVLYLTDANPKKFKIVTAALESLSTIPYNAIPECILVGISQDNINMELNTSLESTTKQFKKFILSELFNLINSKFSTSGFNGIIGHNIGADFNQFLMMTNYNPITAYINIGLDLNPKLIPKLERFFNNYNKRKTFYYLSNAHYSAPEIKESFEKIKAINSKSYNRKIDFHSEEYKVGNESLFSASIKDGLLHIFGDYRNLDNYKDFRDYAENYSTDMILTYRVSTTLDPSDIQYFTSKLLTEKDAEQYEIMTNYLDSLSSKNSDFKFNFSLIDKAVHYHKMDLYDTSIEYWNKVLDSYRNDNSAVVNPKEFYNNFTYAVKAYQNSGNPKEGISFLEKSIKVLPQHALAFHYYIAKLSSEDKTTLLKGQESLLYCVKEFSPNIYFTKEDLTKLVYSYGE